MTLPDRSSLMARHAEARRRRDAARLGSDAFREAAEEVARIEVDIARLEEPPPTDVPRGPAAPRPDSGTSAQRRR